MCQTIEIIEVSREYKSRLFILAGLSRDIKLLNKETIDVGLVSIDNGVVAVDPYSLLGPSYPFRNFVVLSLFDKIRCQRGYILITSHLMFCESKWLLHQVGDGFGILTSCLLETGAGKPVWYILHFCTRISNSKP
jgi:hypothetical protein